jgi:hypothetical protein
MFLCKYFDVLTLISSLVLLGNVCHSLLNKTVPNASDAVLRHSCQLERGQIRNSSMLYFALHTHFVS